MFLALLILNIALTSITIYSLLPQIFLKGASEGNTTAGHCPLQVSSLCLCSISDILTSSMNSTIRYEFMQVSSSADNDA
jgi:hypothetical protein